MASWGGGREGAAPPPQTKHTPKPGVNFSNQETAITLEGSKENVQGVCL